jgi:pyruvate decarboxylase
MAPLLMKLIDALSKASLPNVDMPKLAKQDINISSDFAINHNWLWHAFGSFVKSGDIVVCDTGSSQYGLPDAKFPADVHFFSQVYFGSIGYGCPAALGADVARKERPNSKGRTVLVIGDGGLMLTIQEIAVMISEGLAPVM